MRLMTGLLLAVLLAVLMIVAACGGGGGGNSGTTYSMSGTVTSSGTGLQGVTVSLNTGVIATTDANGNYSFANLTSGDYTITPRKTGYAFNPRSRARTIFELSATDISFTAAIPDATSGLVVYSTYDNSSYSDLTGLGHSLTFVGTQTYTSGRTTGAINLDGLTNSILIANDPYTDITAFQNGYTIAAWIYITSMPTSESVIVSKGNDGFKLSVDNSGGFSWYHNRGYGLDKMGITDVLVVNQWQHVAITWDKLTGASYLYCNSKIIIDSPFGTNALSSSSAGALSIGADASVAGSNFKGYIDSVRIYTRGLTPYDISALYDMAQ
jgi:hypothetical protein